MLFVLVKVKGKAYSSYIRSRISCLPLFSKSSCVDFEQGTIRYCVLNISLDSFPNLLKIRKLEIGGVESTEIEMTDDLRFEPL